MANGAAGESESRTSGAGFRSDVEVSGSLALLGGVLDSSHDGIMAFRSVRDPEGHIIDFEWTVVNPAAERIVGRDAQELLGLRLLEEMPGNAESGLFDHYVEVVETGRAYSVEHHYEHENMDHWFSTTAVRLDDGFTVTFRDVTEQKNLQSTLEQQALHDQLTGLPNRVLFESRVAHALERLARRARSVAVLFIDLDRFKVVNDGLGHHAGDQLLIEVSRRCAALARPGDTVARFGGDEFVVLCEDLGDDHDVSGIAHRFLKLSATPFHIMGRAITVSASIGVVTASSSDTDPASLISNADAAMYKAKARGGSGMSFFDDALQAEVTERLETEIELRHAIKNGELCVHYQPVVCTASDRVVAAEALVRWQHPRHGLLAPGRFIHVAEETGLVVPLGAQVLQDAIDQLVTWRQELGDRAPRSIAVNVAAAQLAVPRFADAVIDMLSAAGLEPQALCLEVTETALIRDPVTAEMTLDALAARGVSIALDDFGTGYSPLAYLQRFPVDIIKIDRSFIGGLGSSSADTALVAALIALAESLDKVIVAEGIETTAQLESLRQLGDHHYQGYHFSPPVTPAEFAELVSSANRA